MNVRNDEVYKYVLKTRMYDVMSIRSSLWETEKEQPRHFPSGDMSFGASGIRENKMALAWWGKDMGKLMLGT
jgi:hypothetical protein